MKIGLISDTHDHVPMIERAVRLFNKEAVDLVLHAGDYVSPFSLKPFLSLECDMRGVWGNNDGDKMALNAIAQGRIVPSPLIETIAGQKILLAHELETLDALVASRAFRMIVYGHTHQAVVRKEGGTLVVNPGECGGWVSGNHTVALVDLENETAEIRELL